MGGVPASQSDWEQERICLHASMTHLYTCFQSAVNSNFIRKNSAKTNEGKHSFFDFTL
jgi:hypothetical protein